ncbi:apoptosis-enhancing nuclease-like [Acanthaster planci]|uniref:RNA exonuclease 4 n=1 Tax=Acanthaster planci TaxID=133434 RepID=A0A8B7Y1Y0_ACAPL|nr:apoptosis-enhancing nuclease-like [Acanthaster planci]
MPSAKVKGKADEAGHQALSASGAACPGSQSLRQPRKRTRKNKAKKAAKKKMRNMKLPTRLARLLSYKAKRASLEVLQAESVQSNQTLQAGSTALTHCDKNVSPVVSSDRVKGFLEGCKNGCSSTFHKALACSSSHGENKSNGTFLGDINSRDGSSDGWRLIPKEKLIALDCEMVGVGPQGRTSALGRCSIVDYDCNILYDSYIKPELAIFHYRTPWSGIRKHHMVDAVPFREAQQQIAGILQGKILIGHALISDIQVLQLGHPWEDTRDTSMYKGLCELAGLTIGPGQHPSLKRLTKQLFGHSIQQGEHCSVEDARATMNLYKLVERQWEEERVSGFSDKGFRVSFMDDHFWPEDLDQ